MPATSGPSLRFDWVGQHFWLTVFLMTSLLCLSRIHSGCLGTSAVKQKEETTSFPFSMYRQFLFNDHGLLCFPHIHSDCLHGSDVKQKEEDKPSCQYTQAVPSLEKEDWTWK
jgi:hypothetical protein